MGGSEVGRDFHGMGNALAWNRSISWARDRARSFYADRWRRTPTVDAEIPISYAMSLFVWPIAA